MNQQNISKILSKKSQVITFRVPVEVYHQFEERCLELQQPMTDLLRQAVKQFLHPKKGELNS